MFPWQQFAHDSTKMNQIALHNSQGEVFTWQQLNQRIQHDAALLQAQGVSEQSGVALCGKNEMTLLCLYLATIQLGARVLPLNPAFSREKIQQVCLDADIQFYFSLIPLVVEGCQPLCLNLDIAHAIDDSIVRSDSAAFLRPATMTLTSGSTGRPKAVVHHVQAHLDNAEGVCQLMQFSEKNSWLLSLPLYHVSGQGIVWRWLLTGAVLHFPQADFYASVSEVSHVSLVPTQLQRLLTYWREHAIQHVKTAHILLGGAQISPELTQQLTAWQVNSYSGYGMTEMASTVFAKLSDEKRGVGQPLMNREYQLVEQEIWLKGAGLALGYWKNGMIFPLTNQQGWLQTKDKGMWCDNELVILGRVDNMFISGGENIQPEEIEKWIQQWQFVKQVFVLPKNDLEFGHRPVAFIEFTQPFSLTLVQQLQDWLSDKLEKFKHPVQYFQLDSQTLQQGAIKISRADLKIELEKLVGKNQE
ncbi:O-succinylbenzoic acid--CoA ligase [Pasteurella multocida subsp. multocida OH4807]|nr:O-succinylbenzoic acid--CoA ligase [Pasteurella multocida subsp. multocida OH4807]